MVSWKIPSVEPRVSPQHCWVCLKTKQFRIILCKREKRHATWLYIDWLSVYKETLSHDQGATRSWEIQTQCEEQMVLELGTMSGGKKLFSKVTGRLPWKEVWMGEGYDAPRSHKLFYPGSLYNYCQDASLCQNSSKGKYWVLNLTEQSEKN